jgi:hypothetical protein
MISKTMSCAAAILLVLLGSSADAAEKGRTRRYVGKAYDLETGDFIYTENHTEHYEDGKHAFSIVSYRDPKGEEMVRKRIVFRKSRSAPTFRAVDYRTGYLEAAMPAEDGYRLTCRPIRSSETESTVVDIPEPAVIDGGFDYFIRDNWDDLVAGKNLTLYFAVVHRLDYAKFSLRKVGRVMRQGVRCVQFRLRVTGLLARLFVDPIDVAYDLEHKRLIEYKGVSNIHDDTGTCYDARIVFTYPWMQQAPDDRRQLKTD